MSTKDPLDVCIKLENAEPVLSSEEKQLVTPHAHEEPVLNSAGGEKPVPGDDEKPTLADEEPVHIKLEDNEEPVLIKLEDQEKPTLERLYKAKASDDVKSKPDSESEPELKPEPEPAWVTSKAAEIRKACAIKDIPQLQKLALSEGGLLNDDLRRTA
ncbi:hypothetical protein TD95_001144, partial [Thielaviopsis punctulata]